MNLLFIQLSWLLFELSVVEKGLILFLCNIGRLFYIIFLGGRQENCFPFNFSFLIFNNSMQNKNVLEITHALVIPKNIAKKYVKCETCFLKTYVL